MTPTRLSLLPRFAAVATLLLLGVACKEKEPPPPPPPAAAPVPPADPVAPDSFRARIETSKGTFTIELNRTWSPLGVDRFYRLAQEGYFNDVRFFRVMKGFVAQFGMSGDPALNARWDSMRIPDDPVLQSNKRGTIVFATAGPNTRSNQLFINFSDNTNLDGMGFSPIGRVVDGMKVVDAIYSEYGDGPPGGAGPDQGRLRAEGNKYLIESYPRLDYIKSVTIVAK